MVVPTLSKLGIIGVLGFVKGEIHGREKEKELDGINWNCEGKFWEDCEEILLGFLNFCFRFL